MLKWFISVLVFLVTLIVAMSLFLAPNNLMNCSETPNSLTGCGKADVIIAVSGGDTAARTQTAIDLYQNGWAPKLIFSGAAADTSGPSNAEVMRRQAIKQGVPESAIFIEETSQNTKENAIETKSIITDKHLTSAIVVTSGYHMKRTILEFQSQAPGVEFRAYPTSGDSAWGVWWWLSPWGWYLSLSETVKIIVFYLGLS
ncbi:MAG TPA: YdcF family protein [Candidatus Saccharibacteria bacterium]|jgi:uncharacterized SAM-binding protein YcdF (DUF218 family)|nr:YdcF family protein [Candidatus Saccharibacteria bacterium]HMR38278.1 YdcF family protein [Candidatus Saccharibacteria bacterium]